LTASGPVGSSTKPPLRPSRIEEAAVTKPEAVNLARKLSVFTEQWSPKIVASFNGHEVMVVKVKGRFVWHAHPETDDFFLVLNGRLTIEMREGGVTLGPGELYVVPRGVEHCPVAEEETELLLIEPAGTPNTGDPRTAAIKTKI
jgi:mannose-6-phosphate isomerase-like protein (cupin superfamily)